MDISSGNVTFGLTCPGVLMQQLLKDDIENVRSIKKFQTSFSKNTVFDQCFVGCGNLNIVKWFIQAISNLEELSVLNYEADTSILWSAIFQQAESLRSLAIHSPPQMQIKTWTPSRIKEVDDRLPHIQIMEVDISLEDAENYLKMADPSHKIITKQQTPSALDELVKMHRLESLRINVKLADAASTFAGQHTWNAMGSIFFPSPYKGPCSQLAQQIFRTFHSDTVHSSLQNLELRFPRRCWDDRAQFWTLAYSVHVKMVESEIRVDDEGGFKPYMPEPPQWGNNVLR